MTQAILMNPGPVNLSERVRNALAKPDLCHRETEFIDLQNTIRRNLLKIYNLDPVEYAAVLLTGSGTASVEAMLTSMVPADGKLLIIENGVYGERMARIAEIYNIPHQTLQHDWLDGVDIARLEDLLSGNHFSHVAVVQHETTTGRLNDLAEIGRICAAFNTQLLVDGVSSFGAETLEFTNWSIAACAATANKCLHGVPGTSFVIANREALQKEKVKPRNLYLDLNTYLQQQDANGTPFTQSVQCFYALDEALRELFDEGGWQARQKSYRKRMKIVRDGLKDCGIKPLLKDSICSCVLNAFHLPKNIKYQTLHDKLKEQGFVIYAGQGDLAKTLFRISCMGAVSQDAYHRFITVMQTIQNPSLN